MNPHRDQRVKNYFDRVAGLYARRSATGLWRRFRVRELRVVFELLEPQRGERILEVGAGAGFYTEYLLEKNVLVEAIDSSVEMVEAMRKRGIDAHQGDAQKFSSDGHGLFDGVLAAGVLEFLAKPMDFFASSQASLKASGRLVILIPRSGVFGLFYQIWHELSSCPVSVRNKASYIEMAASQGFALEKTRRATLISEVLLFRPKPSRD